MTTTGGPRLSSVIALVLGTLSVSACGGSADPDAIPAVPAAGTVTYQGKPLETGEIQFLPDKGRTATGTIEKGAFTMNTYGDGDGAIPGTHKVTVYSVKEVRLKGGDSEAKYITPEKYASPDSSGLTLEIPSDGKTDIVIDLK